MRRWFVFGERMENIFERVWHRYIFNLSLSTIHNPQNKAFLCLTGNSTGFFRTMDAHTVLLVC